MMDVKPGGRDRSLLGYESIKTTERHYAKWVKGRQDRLDALVTATWRPDNEHSRS